MAKGNWKPDPKHQAKEPDHHCNGKVRQKNSEDDGAEAYCSKVAGWGTDHSGYGRCKWHGGASPTYDVKVHEQKAKEALKNFGLPVPVDPQEALLEELFRTKGHVLWLEERVGELHTEQMHGAVGGASGGIPEHKQHVWITMLDKERFHYIRVAKACVDAGIEERRVRLAEEQGAQLAQVVKGILSALDIPLDSPKTRKIVREQFQLVELNPA